jgi:hypothetical protein
MPEEERLHQVEAKLHTHIQRFEEFQASDAKRWSDLIDSQEVLLATQQHNTDSLQLLTESSQGVIDAWIAANGAVKVASALGKFIKWIGGLGFLGVSIVWVASKLPSDFFK